LNGKEHGFGTYIDSQGRAKDGEWEEGKWKRWILKNN